MNSYSHRVNENDLIQRIKIFGQQIFQTCDPSLDESSLQFTLTQSDYGHEAESQIIKTPLTHIHQNHRERNITEYAKEYISPYSKKSFQYSTSRTQRNTSKQSENLRKKLEKIRIEQYQEINCKRKKQGFQNKTHDHIKSKYLQKEPLMKKINKYVTKNFYEDKQLQQNYNTPKKQYTRQESEKKWKKFLDKEKEWSEQKRTKIIQQKFQKQLELSEQLNKRPKIQPAPETTMDDYIRRLHRQSIKLKQQLQNHKFQPMVRQRPQKSKEKIFGPRNMPIVLNPKKQLDFILH